MNNPILAALREGLTKHKDMKSILDDILLKYPECSSEFLYQTILGGHKLLALEIIDRGILYQDPYTKGNSFIYKTPFIVLASSHGSIELVKTFYSKKRKFSETGVIGYSKYFLNSLISNCLGAASYQGHCDTAEFIVNTCTEELHRTHRI